jgi:hypothetical protein
MMKMAGDSLSVARFAGLAILFVSDPGAYAPGFMPSRAVSSSAVVGELTYMIAV